MYICSTLVVFIEINCDYLFYDMNIRHLTLQSSAVHNLEILLNVKCFF